MKPSARKASAACSADATYGEIRHPNYNFQYGFSLLGPIGATIVYLALCLISLLFLTNFQLGGWIRALLQKNSTEIETEKSGDEAASNAARANSKSRRNKLQEQVARCGLGADGLPVPEPTVRDLSVPQAKPATARFRKTTLPANRQNEIAPPDEGEVIPAQRNCRRHDRGNSRQESGKHRMKQNRQKRKLKTRIKLNLKNQTNKKPSRKLKSPESSQPNRNPESPSPSPSRTTPMIGNYQLPPLDFLQHPDMTVKPTESKEELMANARLMQQTLAQFDIEVSLGDITKGPTITRYELHPAPGVKLEKIAAL